MIQDMLNEGLIKPNTNPFCSPVLLVKKCDTWRFYGDYRALNALTTKNRFLIINIDEYLDELYGSTISQTCNCVLVITISTLPLKKRLK